MSDRYLVAALLGRQVTFGDQLPYPPDDASVAAYAAEIFKKIQTDED
jgi:hypothetical protein